MPVLTVPPRPGYSSYNDLCTCIPNVKLEEQWQIIPGNEFVRIYKTDDKHMLPIFDIYVERNLKYTLRVFCWCIPDDHELYTWSHSSRSVKNITLEKLISNISSYEVCYGITNSEVIKSELIKHIVPKIFVPSSEEHTILQTGYDRSPKCQVLSYTKQCKECVLKEGELVKQKKTPLKSKKRKSTEKVLMPAKLHASISQTNPERLKLTMQNYRNENKELKSQIHQLQQELSRSYLPIIVDQKDCFVSIMENTDKSKMVKVNNNVVTLVPR